jgi:6-phosphogluconate dehydrogenase
VQVGMVGLGRMGANLVRRLTQAGHACVVHDLDPEAVRRLEAEGATGASALDALVAALRPPRVVWIMLPAGVVHTTVDALAGLLEPGDTVIDGGNSYYRDDIARAGALRPGSIAYVDVGTSGGVRGLERGFCLMVGGDDDVVARLEPVFAALAPGVGAAPRTPGRAGAPAPAEQGYLHCGPAGAGHFVKMVHNGIEYGLMAAYAEGMNILHGAPDYDLDLAEISEVWRRGSVVSSWLLDLTAEALHGNAELGDLTGHVADSGEGRWTVMGAVEAGIPADVLTTALYARFSSRGEADFANRVLSAMRRAFGGHQESPA